MSDIDDCLKSVERLTRDRGEVMRAGDDAANKASGRGGERVWAGRDEHLARIAVRGGITHAQMTAKGAVDGVDPAVRRLATIVLREIVGDIDGYVKRAGISRSTLAKWRQGKRDPKLSVFRAAANAAGYDLRLVRKDGHDE